MSKYIHPQDLKKIDKYKNATIVNAYNKDKYIHPSYTKYDADKDAFFFDYFSGYLYISGNQAIKETVLEDYTRVRTNRDYMIWNNFKGAAEYFLIKTDPKIGTMIWKT